MFLAGVGRCHRFTRACAHRHTDTHRSVRACTGQHCVKKKNTSWTDGLRNPHDVQPELAQSVLLLHGLKHHG